MNLLPMKKPRPRISPMVIMLASALLLGGVRPASALDNGLARTPPMGWNSWNKFGCNVSESLIKGIADAMVTSGLQAAGYEYVNIDDCWQVSRDSAGNIVADASRFPSGMKALADYVHAKGLKLGVYTDAGTATCAGRPGTLNHEQQDARTYASWGVDYVKEDWCSTSGLDPATQYAKFRDALAATNRPILFSICNWGVNSPWNWGPTTGNMWRTTGDISDRWSSMLSNLDSSSAHASAARPGAWNDPDMLEVGNGGMTSTEYHSHMSLWAIMAAPLIAGNDIRSMSQDTRDTLTNPEVLAVDQDPAGIQGTKVSDNGAGLQVWAKKLQQSGAVAVALFNRSGSTATITASWSAVGLPAGGATVRDLWARADRGSFTGSYSASVPSHGTVLVKIVAGSGGGTLTVTRNGAGTGTVTSSPSGINCGSTCSATFASGTAVTLTATPDSGSSFTGFGGACVGTGTCIVTMTGNQAVTATFGGTTPPGPISISAGGTASGSFVADTDYTGGSTYSTTSAIDTSQLTGTVPPQSVLQHERYGAFTYTIPGLTPGSPYAVTLYFVESYWTAAGQRLFDVAINGTSVLSAFDIFAAAGGANKAIARTFDAVASSSGQVVIAFTAGSIDNPKVDGIAVADATGSYTLTVNKADTGTGTVAGGAINCGATCSATLAGGTTVTLTATAASNSIFVRWSGACSGSSATCTVTMTGAQTVTASFIAKTPPTYVLTVTRAGTGSGTVSSSAGEISCGSTCSATVAGGTTLTLTAAAASGSTFAGWGGACTGTSATCTVSMSAAQAVTATFNPIGPTCTAASGGQSGNFNTTGAICFTVSGTINGWGCSNADGRTVTVNGTATTCGKMPLPGSSPYTFSFTAGTYPWASFYWW